MKRHYDAQRALAMAAGAVIIALTAAAFWLSYAHLAQVAATYGLHNSPARTWAWPATLDLFVIAGELLMLRAALTKSVDPWAIGLTVIGSGGSIALNVAGVGTTAAVLNYVVAAVPPTAALLAFGALMRQVHQALAAADTAVDIQPVSIPEPSATDAAPDTDHEPAEEATDAADTPDTPDTDTDIQQVRALPPGGKSAAILAAVSTLGSDTSPADIAAAVSSDYGVAVDASYVRTALWRDAKRRADAADTDRTGGYL